MAWVLGSIQTLRPDVSNGWSELVDATAAVRQELICRSFRRHMPTLGLGNQPHRARASQEKTCSWTCPWCSLLLESSSHRQIRRGSRSCRWLNESGRPTTPRCCIVATRFAIFRCPFPAHCCISDQSMLHSRRRSGRSRAPAAQDAGCQGRLWS